MSPNLFSFIEYSFIFERSKFKLSNVEPEDLPGIPFLAIFPES